MWKAGAGVNRGVPGCVSEGGGGTTTRGSKGAGCGGEAPALGDPHAPQNFQRTSSCRVPQFGQYVEVVEGGGGMEGGGGGGAGTVEVLVLGFGRPHVPQNRQSTSNFVPQAGQDPATMRVPVGVYLRRWPAGDSSSAGSSRGGRVTPLPPCFPKWCGNAVPNHVPWQTLDPSTSQQVPDEPEGGPYLVLPNPPTGGGDVHFPPFQGLWRTPLSGSVPLPQDMGGGSRYFREDTGACGTWGGRGSGVGYTRLTRPIPTIGSWGRPSIYLRMLGRALPSHRPWRPLSSRWQW